MAQMIRKQFYIEPRHKAILEQEATRRGVSKSGVVRLAIEKLDRTSAWEDSKKVIDERMKLHVPQTGRNWTREELYDR